MSVLLLIDIANPKQYQDIFLKFFFVDFDLNYEFANLSKKRSSSYRFVLVLFPNSSQLTHIVFSLIVECFSETFAGTNCTEKVHHPEL